MKSYQPSNGTDGEMFMAEFCYRCKKDAAAGACDGEGCNILIRTMINGVTDPDYPTEWVQADDGTNQRCTAFELKENDDG